MISIFTSSYKQNITKAYITKALQSSWVIIATTLLFYKSNGLTLKDLFVLKASLSVTVLFLELPSGYFADVVGRKLSLIMANFIFCISVLITGTGSEFYQFLVGEMLLGLAVCLISGADTALVYESLKELDKEHEFQKVEARLQSIGGYSEACGGLIGSFLASFNLSYPYFFQFFLMAIAFLIALGFKEPHRLEKGLTEKNKFLEIVSVFKYSVFQKKDLSKLIITGAFLGTSTFFAVWYAQGYMDFINLNTAYYGIVWAVLHIILGISSGFSKIFFGLNNNYKTYFIFAVLLFLAYLGLSLSSGIFGLMFIVLCYIVRGLRMPLHNTHLHTLSDSKIRASIFSVQSLIFRILFISLSPMLGYIADFYSLQMAFFLTGLILSAPVILIAFIELKKRKS